MHRSLALALLAPAALLAGCSTGSFNNETAIGNTVLPETFAYDHTGWLPPPSGVNPDAPSVKTDSLSRSHWETYPFNVPVSGVTHFPTYASEPRYNRENARSRGLFPTDDTVLQTTSDTSRCQQTAEGLAAPVWAAADILFMPLRMFTAPPWSDTVTPTGPVFRVPPRAGEWTEARHADQPATQP